MKKVFAVTLGILSAIGGFVDIGDIVANAAIGARYKWALAWVVVVGVTGIVLFAEMAGRVAAVSGRAVFDLVRERLGPRFALANLVGSFFVNLMTLTAEIAGVALALELATDVNYLLWLPVCAFAVWLVIWRVKFETMEDVFGLMGLAMIVLAVTVWRTNPDWGSMFHEGSHPSIASGEGLPTY
jgi:Mn2+/Fe2+ NRAMP family transporter